MLVMKKYYVRFRHIPINLTFTPIMFIPIDHVQVESIKDATDENIRIAISEEFTFIDIDDIRIESYEEIN